jgi:hypothetical protein
MPFFQLPLQGTWEGSLILLPKLIEDGFAKETRMFRKTQAMSLLSAVFHNPILRGQVEPSLNVNLISKIIEAVEIYMKGADMKHRFLCELLHLTHGLYLTSPDSDWDNLKCLLEKLREKVPKNRHFVDVKKAFNKISVLLKIQVVQGSDKRKSNKNEKIEEENVTG